MRLFCTFLLVFFVVLRGVSQVQYSDGEELKVEDLLLGKLSSVRDSTGLTIISNDVALKKAAKHHLKYCLKLGTVKHYEKSIKYKTVVERAKKHGSYHGSVQEFIGRVKVTGKTSENELVDALIKSLFPNPKKRAVLFTKSYSQAGVAVGTKGNYFYAVLVMGSQVVFSEKLRTPDKLYGIKGITAKNKEVCDACRKKFNAMPKEVSYDVFKDKGKVFFVMSSKEWFATIFSEKKDGIAIDIIRKAQFACGVPTVRSGSNLYNGYVLPPVYAKDFKELAYINEYEEVVVPLGEIPEPWRGEELELNLMVLQNNIICRYNTYFRVPFEDWKILDLQFHQKYKLGGKVVNFQEKEMSFEIPFEKGKIVFDSTDIKPLADSLRLTDFTIESIEINAYSSIEGVESQNIDLQEQRANSILEALKSYEKAQVEDVSVKSEENWVEFFNDIEKTEQAFLLKKSKEEIRKYVNTHLTKEMEVLLKNHRKARVRIKLKRKDLETYSTTNSIDQVVAKNNAEEVYFLLHKIGKQKVSTEKKLELLKHLELKILGSVVYSQQLEGALQVQRYLVDKTELSSVLKRLMFLKEQNDLPPTLKINSYLMQLLQWYEKGEIDNPAGLKSGIEALTGLTNNEKNSLLINFYVLETARLFKAKRYLEKDASIREVVRLVAKSELTEEEAFIIARFYADYQKYKEAVNILKPYVYELNANEDLLFLYINLTIIDENVVRGSRYRTALINASQSNKKRFCKLFNSSSSGGITFQLLENKYLKRTYCEQCE